MIFDLNDTALYITLSGAYVKRVSQIKGGAEGEDSLLVAAQRMLQIAIQSERYENAKCNNDN